MLKKKNAHKAKSAKQTKSCCVRLTKSGSRFRTQSQSPISSCARTFARRAAAAAAFDWQPEWLTHTADVGAGQARVREHPQLVSLQLVASHTSRRRIVSVALRCVACQVQFIALKVQIKRNANTNVNATANTHVSVTVNLSQVRTMWHTFNNDSPQCEKGRGGNREAAFVSLSTRAFIAITLILTYCSQIKY